MLEAERSKHFPPIKRGCRIDVYLTSSGQICHCKIAYTHRSLIHWHTTLVNLLFCFFSLSQNSRPNKLLSLTHWNSVACDFCSVSQPFEMYLYFTLYNQNLCTIQRLTPSVQMRSEWNVNCFFLLLSVFGWINILSFWHCSSNLNVSIETVGSKI